MRDNKHIQSFNEHRENLNISDVSDSLNESLESERKMLMEELSNLGKQIRKLQSEYDDKIKEIHKIEDKIDKELKNSGKKKRFK